MINRLLIDSSTRRKRFSSTMRCNAFEGSHLRFQMLRTSFQWRKRCRVFESSHYRFPNSPSTSRRKRCSFLLTSWKKSCSFLSTSWRRCRSEHEGCDSMFRQKRLQSFEGRRSKALPNILEDSSQPERRRERGGGGAGKGGRRRDRNGRRKARKEDEDGE